MCHCVGCLRIMINMEKYERHYFIMVCVVNFMVVTFCLAHMSMAVRVAAVIGFRRVLLYVA